MPGWPMSWGWKMAVGHGLVFWKRSRALRAFVGFLRVSLLFFESRGGGGRFSVFVGVHRQFWG